MGLAGIGQAVGLVLGEWFSLVLIGHRIGF
jgi:hypothetical protein